MAYLEPEGIMEQETLFVEFLGDGPKLLLEREAVADLQIQQRGADVRYAGMRAVSKST